MRDARCLGVTSFTGFRVGHAGGIVKSLARHPQDILSKLSTCIRRRPLVPFAFFAQPALPSLVAVTPKRIGKVDNLAACGPAGGWYYDVNLPARPSQINLCAEPCDRLRATPNSKVELLIGCPAVP